MPATAVVQIVEADQERDRKACLTLDMKVTGANRELAQWLLDHPRYTAPMVAGWLGCGETRIKSLRRWAEGGFEDLPNSRSKRSNRRPAADDSLESLDNSEDDFEDDVDSKVAAPEVVIDNLLHSIGGMNESARVFNKVLKASVFDREAVTQINTAIDRMIEKWRSIQSTLEKKG